MEFNTIQQLSYYYNLVVAFLAYYLTYLWDMFRDFPFVIQLAVAAICLGAFAHICICLRLVVVSYKQRKYKRIMDDLKDRYAEPITYILSKEANPIMSRREILDTVGISQRDNENNKKTLKDDRERMAFCRLVYQIRISKKATVGRRRNLHTLLSIFSIQPFLEDVVNKGETRLQAEALHMLRAFKLTINPWVANQQIHAKRKRLHRLAMFASIMSSSNTDLDYFESEFFDKNSCLYDEIQLAFVLQRRRSLKIKLPNLAHLAHMQENPESQCIFIRLMRRFNQREYCSDLEELFFRNKDKQVVEEIARTWGYLRYAEGEKPMRDILLTQPDDTKVTIMHALTRIGSGQSLNALIDGYQNSGNPHVSFEALRCLYHYGEVGKAKFTELELTASESQRNYFAFFHNPIVADKIVLSRDEAYQQSVDTIYSVS